MLNKKEALVPYHKYIEQKVQDSSGFNPQSPLFYPDYCRVMFLQHHLLHPLKFDAAWISSGEDIQRLIVEEGQYSDEPVLLIPDHEITYQDLPLVIKSGKQPLYKLGFFIYTYYSLPFFGRYYFRWIRRRSNLCCFWR
jgi:hypothetical protein